MMKAIYASSYGLSNVLSIQEVPKPVIKDNEILIKILATPINIGDSRIRRADPPIVKLVFGFTRPRNPILGINFSGVVESVGNKVTKFKVGDEVYGSTGLKMGTHCEYCKIKEDGLVIIKPDNINHEEASSLFFGYSTATHFISKIDNLKDKTVLLNGASGAVGTAMLQLLKNEGATVTTFTSLSSIELVKSLEADICFDYNINKISEHDIQYDIVIDCVNKIPINDCIRLCKENGYIIAVNASFKDMIFGAKYCKKRNVKYISGTALEKYSQLVSLNDLVKINQYEAVYNRYKFEEFREANDLVDSGKKKGNVILVLHEQLR